MNIISEHKNGNATVQIQSNGTRIIEFPDNELLQLEFPLNVDIRVSTKCSFGYNPKTNKSVCAFCHESATTDGKECDYNSLFEQIKILPMGTELAIGANDLTEGLRDFLQKCNQAGYICNVTVNQGHIKPWVSLLKKLVQQGDIKGLGISYRKGYNDIPKCLLGEEYYNEELNTYCAYDNAVVHVIAGIDDVTDIIKLRSKGVKKLLVLGEKDFGFNLGKVNLKSPKHIMWYNNLHKILETFDIVSFDNLALQQLNVKRFLTPKQYQQFYQGEHSLYINAVDQYFSPSSRNIMKISWSETNVVEFFKKYVEKES